MRGTLISIGAAVGVATLFVGCGGGSGGGGIIAPANPPTCSSIVTSSAQARGPIAGGDPRIWVPPTSLVKDSDAGLRAHTNYLILRRGSTRDSSPTGLTPAQLDVAYGIPTGGGSGAIAIVDAYNYPTALNDFNVFSSTFSLPTESSSNATSSGNSVFQVVYSDSNGAATSSAPVDDGGWSQEMSLDVEWAHAVAPGAKIYLVEAVSNGSSDLFAAVALAKTLPGVKQVSMSFGVSEAACSFVHYNSVLLQSGVTFFAAAGDTAGERDFPAESFNVVAVGGTSLSVGVNGQWLGETVWDGTGGGVSAYEPRPTFQNVVVSTVGAYRGACDIAADGDPNTGVSTYDSYAFQGFVGWQTVGGTSASCPIIAGIANVSAAVHSGSQAQNATFYTGIGGPNFHDITKGTSGNLKAGTGWDLPTGVGTPNGTGGF